MSPIEACRSSSICDLAEDILFSPLRTSFCFVDVDIGTFDKYCGSSGLYGEPETLSPPFGWSSHVSPLDDSALVGIADRHSALYINIQALLLAIYVRLIIVRTSFPI